MHHVCKYLYFLWKINILPIVVGFSIYGAARGEGGTQRTVLFVFVFNIIFDPKQFGISNLFPQK